MGYPLVCLYPRLLAEVGYLGYNEDDDAIDNRNEDTLVPAIYSWRRYQIGWGHIARLVKRPKRLLQNVIHLIEAECAKEETTSQRDKANVTKPCGSLPCSQEYQGQQKCEG